MKKKYTVVMVAHLASPWLWEQCLDPVACPKILHSHDASEVLNGYPPEWIAHLFPGFIITDLQVASVDSNGDFHNDDGPAVEKFTGTMVWYRHGQLHREKGPAIISFDGDVSWFLNGEKHRENGPAEIRSDGTKIWYRHGRIHRQHGPAVIQPGSRGKKWLNGQPKRGLRDKVVDKIVEFFIS